jgi:hypothetical protein
MKLQLVAFLFFLSANFYSGSTSLGPGTNKCAGSKEKANADLKKGKVEFLIQGGIVARRFEGDQAFELSYNIQYRDLGCLMPADLCLDVYNQEVAVHLDQKYGKGWRKQVRRDVPGL